MGRAPTVLGSFFQTEYKIGIVKKECKIFANFFKIFRDFSLKFYCQDSDLPDNLFSGNMKHHLHH